MAYLWLSGPSFDIINEWFFFYLNGIFEVLEIVRIPVRFSLSLSLSSFQNHKPSKLGPQTSESSNLNSLSPFELYLSPKIVWASSLYLLKIFYLTTLI